MLTTTFEKGVAKGREEGQELGRRLQIRELLEYRFGSLNEAVLNRLAQWPVEKLKELGRAVVDGKSLRELGLED